MITVVLSPFLSTALMYLKKPLEGIITAVFLEDPLLLSSTVNLCALTVGFTKNNS